MEYAEQPASGVLKPRVGDRLRSAREAQGLSVEDVASHTRVPKRLLEMIESGEHDALPAPTYSAGFVKSYAKLLGLDPVELSRQFREELGRSSLRRHSPEPFAPADPARVPSRFLAIVALIVALLIAGSYALWRSGRLSGDDADATARLAAGTAAPPAAAAPVALAPAPTPAVAPAAAPAAAGPVVLTATETVWFKIYERAGRTLFTGEMPVGQHFEIPADAVDPLLRTGRPEALAITVGGRAIPPLGAPSTLVRDASLARDALLARAAAASAPPPAAGAVQ